MSFADEPAFAAFVGRDDMLPAVTPVAVTKALAGFALPLSPGRDMEWLAMAVRRSLAIAEPHISEGPKRTPNTKIRAELEGLATSTEKAWRKLFECSDDAESRLWWFALSRWAGEGGIDAETGVVIGDPSEHRRFKAAIGELDWVVGFLREAARTIPVQTGPWGQSAQRELRTQRGQYLAVIFEAAFDVPVSANNFPTDKTVNAPTPFMDFYVKMVTLAFGNIEATNFTEVVKDACKRHSQGPARFGDGVIPGL